MNKRITIFILAMVVCGSLFAAKTSSGFKPYKTELMKGGDSSQSVSVDISGQQDLYLVVTIGPDNYSSDQAIWAEPKLIDKDGNVVDLTTVKPVSHKVGWGKLFINNNQRSQPLNIAGTAYEKGYWAHGPSYLHFKLNGKYTRFESQVGIDRGADTAGSVEFVVSNVAPKQKAMANKGKIAAPKVALKAPSADKSKHEFNPKASQALLSKGIDKLVFIRRYTLTANHVYTEYLNSRWMPGGGLTVLDLKTGAAKDLVPGLEGVVNRFDVSFDAKKVIFDLKKSNETGYRIYEVDVTGKNLKQLTFPQDDEAELVEKYNGQGYHHGTDDMHPCYLPDGGIVFTTTRCQYGILCNSPDIYTTKNLYRMDGDGKNMRPLTHSAVSEASPAIMHDGRILYHRWEYIDKAAGNLKCLWSMKPDGSATAEVYGNAITFPETMIYARPIPGTVSKIVMLGTSHCCPNNAMGAVIVIDTSDDIRSVDTMKFVTDDIRALAHTGFHFRDEKGKWALDKTGTKGRLFKDPYPVSEDLFIATMKPKGPVWSAPLDYDLVLLDAKGTATSLYKDDEISCWHPYPLVSREKPPALTSTLDPEMAKKNLSLCVMTDVYTGMENVDRGTVKYLRILEQVPRPWAMRKTWYKDDRDGMAHSAIGLGFLGLRAQYGVVPVEEDGSAQFYVPSERNIFFQALDENYLAVQTERTYIHNMPGETRSCLGCHETPNQTPRQVRSVPIATKRAPSTPTAQPGEISGKKLFDYDRQIQPIWNKHCVKCHNPKEDKGKFHLVGDPWGTYSVSYYSLMKLGNSSKQLLGNRKLRNENAGSAGIEYMPPYSLGALTSPLAAMLSKGRIKMRDPKLQEYADKLIDGHKDRGINLSNLELLRITNWLDVNCPFHPSYWGRLNAKFVDHPNYRPNITFEEALLREVPESVAKAEATAKAVSMK